MPAPQSPFDEPDQHIDLPARGWELPARKWSFVALGVVLFVLVWVRELTHMPPAASISIALLVLVGWAMVHVMVYTDLHKWIRDLPHSAGRAGSELVERPPRVASNRAVRVVGVVGLIGGIWLHAMVPTSPLGLSLVVLMIAGFIYGTAALAARL